jgi:hypothetical protein
MLTFQLRRVSMLCGLAAMFFIPSTSDAGCFTNWLYGTSPNSAAITTYTPPYVATGYEAPACATPVGGCSSCGQQVVQYAPYVSYRPTTVPSVTFYPTSCNTCAATTAYYPSSGCSSGGGLCGGCGLCRLFGLCGGSCAAPAPCSTCAAPVTTYYPAVAVARPISLIPYTSYRMAYMPVTYYSYAIPTATCAPACASPCASSCGSPCGLPYGSPCGYGSSCGSPYASPGCETALTYDSSPSATSQPAISNTYVTPPTQQLQPSAPVTNPEPSNQSTPPPTTFQEQKPAASDTKPSTDTNTTNPSNSPYGQPDLKPIPRIETKLNSMPEPRLLDPENRTTSAPVLGTIRLASRPVSAVEAAPQVGVWREAKE